MNKFSGYMKDNISFSFFFFLTETETIVRCTNIFMIMVIVGYDAWNLQPGMVQGLNRLACHNIQLRKYQPWQNLTFLFPISSAVPICSPDT